MTKKIISLTLLIIFLAIIPLVSSCYTDAECSNGGSWFVYGDKQVARESCINERCQIEDTMRVECSKDSDCGNGEVCQKVGNPEDWYCTKGQGDSNYQDTNPQIINNQTDYTPMVVAGVIIGICIIVGFIILAIVLRKKRK